jgi:hypothetical protein
MHGWPLEEINVANPNPNTTVFGFLILIVPYK